MQALRLVPIFAWCLAASTAAAREAYYMVIFAAQDQDYNVSPDTHNFATFVKAEGHVVREAFTISWLPRSLRICIPCRSPEPGSNLTLDQSLALETRNALRISRWGPVGIRNVLFKAAKAQWQRLEEGHLQYLLIDRDTRREAVNCIHAITDMTEVFGQSSLMIGPVWGNAAGWLIYDHLKPWTTGVDASGEWLAAALDLDRWHVQRAQ